MDGDIERKQLLVSGAHIICFVLNMIWSSRYFHGTASAGDSGPMTVFEYFIVFYSVRDFMRLSAPGGPTGRIRHS